MKIILSTKPTLTMLLILVSTSVLGINWAYVLPLRTYGGVMMASNAPQSVLRLSGAHGAHRSDLYGQRITPGIDARFSRHSETDNPSFNLGSLSCKAKPPSSGRPSKAAPAPRRGQTRPSQPAQRPAAAVAAAPASRGTAAERLQWAATPDAILDVFMRSLAPPSFRSFC